MQNTLKKRKEMIVRRLSTACLGLCFMSVLLLTSVGCGGAPSSHTDSDASTLKVGMECAYAPYNWSQGDDSNGAVAIAGSSEFANGYDVQVAKQMAAAMGKRLEIVRSDWDSLVPAVQSGVVDCVIAGQSITPERLEQVAFTKPYYRATIVALTRKDSPYVKAQGVQDLKGARVTSQLNTIWYDTCLPQIPEAQILAGQADAPAMLVALQSGICDLLVTDRPTAQMAIATDPNLVLLDFAAGSDDFRVEESDVQIGISVQKGNQELLDALNHALDSWGEEKQDAQMKQAISWQLQLQQGAGK